MDPGVRSGSWLIIAPLATQWNRFSSYWRELKGLDIPTPATELIPLEESEDGTATWDTERIIATMDAWDIGRAFIRSDYKAAPSRLKRGSYINSQEEGKIDRTITSLLTQHSAAGWEKGEVLVLREQLDLDFCIERQHTNCHPEVRFFIEDGEVLGGTPIEIGPENICSLQYKSLTEVLEQADCDDPRKYANTVADHFTQKTWAVDFVMDTKGDWYCTEMGLNAVRWVEEEDNWMNHCDHSDLEAFGPKEIHSAALNQAKTPKND